MTGAQGALFHVPTGVDLTDRVVDMLRGISAALGTATPRREGCKPHLVTIEFAFDPEAPFEETLALFLRNGFLSWRDVARTPLGPDGQLDVDAPARGERR